MIYRVFDPLPVLTEGSKLEFEAGKYHLVKDGKRVATGDVIDVDEDLLALKHNPYEMMIQMAKLRKLVRERNMEELLKWLPES